MEYIVFQRKNIGEVVPLYMDYYNTVENGQWTEETTYKRIDQMLRHTDSYGLIIIQNGKTIGFAMGYFEQFDDGVGYNLIEIVVEKSLQNQGIGSQLMCELEKHVREMGAMLISLQAVNDAQHHRFYERLGYGDCKNFVIKVKML